MSVRRGRAGPASDVVDAKNEISCSIEETNRIRASLGLRPLRLSPQREPQRAREGPPRGEGERQRRRGREAREGAEASAPALEERAILALKSIAQSALEDEEEDIEDTAQWVEKMRRGRGETGQLDLGKKEEKGGGEREKSGDGGRVDQNEEKDEATGLKGLKIRHKVEALASLEDGAILTLADREILKKGGKELEEGEDEFENVTLLEKEHASRDSKLRKGLDSLSEEGRGIDGVLSKYDEAAAEMTTIGEDGSILGTKKKIANGRTLESNSFQTDAVSAPTFESDYYTPAEYAALFKKRPKKKRTRRRKRDEGDQTGVLGSSTEINGPNRDFLPEVVKTDAMDSLRSRARKIREQEVVNDQEEEEEGRYVILEEARQKRMLNQEKELERLANKIESVREGGEDSGIVLNEIEEFARSIGSGSRSLFPARNEDSDSDRGENNEGSVGRSDASLRHTDPSLDDSKNRTENRRTDDAVDNKQSESLAFSKVKNAADIFLDDAPAGSSMAAALSTFRSKGDLSVRTKLMGRANDKVIDTSTGDLPLGRKEIKLEYVDEFGRELTPKEAFRLMCHKFHGKGPGKNKTEKRLGRYLQEIRLKSKMTGGDTPLGGVKALMSEQKKLGAVGVVVQGKTAMRNSLGVNRPLPETNGIPREAAGSFQNRRTETAEMQKPNGKRAREANIELDFAVLPGKRRRKSSPPLVIEKGEAS